MSQGKYDILTWVDYFKKSKGQVNPKSDFLESKSLVLYPGRFYVLEYMSNTKERFNTRPVILSMGVSQLHKDEFLCIDLSVIPQKARLVFIDMFFKLYYKDIIENIVEHPTPEGADEQTWMKDFSYENICKAVPMLPVKNAIKRYKIKNTRRIYSVPFSNVYRIVGDYSDENYYKNGTIKDVQDEFLKKMMRK